MRNRMKEKETLLVERRKFLTPDFLITLMILLSACASKKIEKLKWQSTEVNVNGRANEYGGMRFYNEETKMFYLLSNDTSNFYLCFKVNDETMQRQIIIAGMDIWVDTTKKTKEQIGIMYPIKINMNHSPDFNRPGGPAPKPDFSKLKQDFILSQNTMQLIGFKNIGTPAGILEYESGLKAKLDWDNENNIVYEIRIPLKTWYKEITEIDSNKVFTLTVNVNAIPMPNMSPSGGMNGPPPQGAPDMGGGFPGGNRPSMSGQMNEMAAMSKKHSFKVNFKMNLDAR